MRPVGEPTDASQAKLKTIARAAPPKDAQRRCLRSDAAKKSIVRGAKVIAKNGKHQSKKPPVIVINTLTLSFIIIYGNVY